MIIYSQITKEPADNFAGYLAKPGYSHSWLKSQKFGITSTFTPSYKVLIGKLVDDIITGQKPDFISEYYPAARAIADNLISLYGTSLSIMENQSAYSGIATYAGLNLRVKGLLDKLLPKYFVLDLKCTFETDVKALTEYMGYFNQLDHYGQLAGVNESFLLFAKLRKDKFGKVKFVNAEIIHHRINKDNSQWKEWILDFGRVKL